jgi:HEAT repeat protein
MADVPVQVAPVVPVPVPSTSIDEGRRERVNRVADEAKKVFAGDQYDESVIGSDDHETRRLVGAELASALVGRDIERRNRARDAFMKHGYFDDATRDLRVAESANERAAAARRLSFVNDREATPHLIAALGDPEPDVRRAAVEALMDSRDPAAIAPLNSLLQNETDRKVPHNLIQQAIDACATATPEAAAAPTSDFSLPSIPQSVPPPVETEREVIEL